MGADAEKKQLGADNACNYQLDYECEYNRAKMNSLEKSSCGIGWFGAQGQRVRRIRRFEKRNPFETVTPAGTATKTNTSR